MKFINSILFLFFTLHYFGSLLLPFLWIFTPKILIIYGITILSWKINNNKCIISQIEYKLTGRTFQGIGKKYYVPRRNRYILYFNFICGIIYYLLYYSINKIL